MQYQARHLLILGVFLHSLLSLLLAVALHLFHFLDLIKKQKSCLPQARPPEQKPNRGAFGFPDRSDTEESMRLSRKEVVHTMIYTHIHFRENGRKMDTSMEIMNRSPP